MEQCSLRNTLEQERRGKHEEGEYNAHQSAIEVPAELPGDHLDAILEVYPGDVEAKRVARKKSDIFQEITPLRPRSTSNDISSRRESYSQFKIAVIQCMIAAHR